MRNWKIEARTRLANLKLDASREMEIVDELAQHLEQRAQELIAQGMPSERAECAALEELEGIERTRNQIAALARPVAPISNAAEGSNWLEETGRNIRYALRGLQRSPGFAIVAILTLALCIGGNMAIFAVVDSILLRPLPFADSARLVTMYNSYPNAGRDRSLSSYPNLYLRQGKIEALSHLAAYRETSAIVGEAGSTDRMSVMRVSATFFDALGAHPRVGRVFAEDEMRYENDGKLIVTDEFWREELDSDPNVLGRTLRLDGLSKTIVGVLPAGFRFLSLKARIYHPLSSREEREFWQLHSPDIEMIGRLKPGETIERASAQLAAHDALVGKDFPQAKLVAESGYRTVVKSLHGDHVESIRPMIWLMQAGVLFLLLIGGVNLVNLMLVRASGRTRELAVRQALGANRGHLLREIVAQNVILAVIGGLAGIGVGMAGIRLLAALGLEQLPLGAEVAFNGRVALTALAASILTGLTLAAPVAWMNLRSHPGGALQAESRSGTVSHAAQMLRQGFIVVQIDLAFVLLAGAGLLGLSLKRALEVAPGFRPDHLITGQFNLPWKSYQTPQAFESFADRTLEKASQLPGTVAVGISSSIPLSGAYNNEVVTVPGYTPPEGSSVAIHATFGVNGRYFEAMGISLLEGRYLNAADSKGSGRACVVDTDFAKRYWGARSPIGQQLYRGAQIEKDEEPFLVVGVVAPVKLDTLTDERRPGSIYFPYRNFFTRNFYLVARTGLAPETLGASLNAVVRNVDPDIPLTDVRSMEVRIFDGLTARRSPALLAAIFSGLALALAAVGTYGLLSYAVSQRRREIGVRVALGALPGQIAAQFLSAGGRLLAIGLLAGLLTAWLAGTAMRGLLFGVPTMHPGILAAAAGTLGLVSLAACLLPSRRASRIEPMEALRAD